MTVSNEDVARLFENLGNLLELKGDSVFKIRACQRAARTINHLSFPLAQAVEAGTDLRQIPGIGKVISEKIYELVKTGRVATYEKLLAELPDDRMGSVNSPGVELSSDLVQHVPEAVRHLQIAAGNGTPWHQALLEAVGLWTLPQEECQGRTYQYMIQGEAFDWLVLAERLCGELDGIIPADEKELLLFWGQLPESVESENFRDLLGVNKYRAYLNFWYGVIVEEALQLSVEEDARKRHTARGYSDTEDLVEETFLHLYAATRSDLLEEFRQHENIPKRRYLCLSDVKGFTYWLHKRRLKLWDPARVTSDTQKGIKKLRFLEHATRVSRGHTRAQG